MLIILEKVLAEVLNGGSDIVENKMARDTFISHVKEMDLDDR